MAWIDYTEDFEVDTGDWYTDSPNSYIFQATSSYEVYEGNKSCRAANTDDMYLVLDLDGTQEGDVELYYYMNTAYIGQNYITIEYYDGTWHTLWSATSWTFNWTFQSEHFDAASKVRIGWYRNSSFYSNTNDYFMFDNLRVNTLSYYPYPQDGSETSVNVTTQGSGNVVVGASGSSETNINVSTQGRGSKYEHPNGGSRAWNFITSEGQGSVFNPVPVLSSGQVNSIIRLDWEVNT